MTGIASPTTHLTSNGAPSLATPHIHSLVTTGKMPSARVGIPGATIVHGLSIRIDSSLTGLTALTGAAGSSTVTAANSPSYSLGPDTATSTAGASAPAGSIVRDM